MADPHDRSTLSDKDAAISAVILIVIVAFLVVASGGIDVRNLVPTFSSIELQNEPLPTK